MTKACKKYCYGNKGNFRFKPVLNKAESNYQESKKNHFVDWIVADINYYRRNTPNFDRIRIHSIGDFYSQSYVNKWYQIIRTLKGIHFTAYTRSHQFDFSNKPKNLSLFYSVDKTTKKYNPTIKRYAYVRDKESYTGNNKNEFTCKSRCFKCRACYTNKHKLNVVFIKNARHK